MVNAAVLCLEPYRLYTHQNLFIKITNVGLIPSIQNTLGPHGLKHEQ
jgi:hypothetical protein